jgi:hypothetical protein
VQTVEELPPVGLTPTAKAAKRISQRETILAMLLAAGERGCTSEELNPVAFRYGAVIFDLRHKEGYIIETLGRRGTELVRYVLKGQVKAGEQVPLF